MIRRLVVLGVVVGFVVGAVIVDAWARRMVAGAVEREVEEALADLGITVDAVDADVGGFPFLGRLIVSGDVRHLSVDLSQVASSSGSVRTVEVDVSDLSVDRWSFLRGDPQLPGFAHVDVLAEVTEADVRSASGFDVEFTPGRIRVRFAGTSVPAGIAVVDGQVRVSPVGADPVVVPLPAELVPCATNATVVADAVELRCRLDALPAALEAALR